MLTGELSPECAAVVGTVLDALSAPAGAEDTRSQAQRYHDGLQEAMRRLVAAGLLPERAGQPVKVVAHISLADLMVLDGSSALQEEWTANVRAAWAARRAAASVSGGDGGAWLDGDAAAAVACDAAMTPVVTGEVNPAALEDLVRLCVDLDRLRRHGTSDGTGRDGRGTGDGTGGTGQDDTDGSGTGGTDGHGTGGGGTGGGQGAPGPDTTRAWEALEQAIIGKAVDLVSGPGGLASFLRRRQLGARLGGPSLPLDVGVSRDIPAAIRRAVILRDQHCRWTGGCDQPAAACEVHHLTHKADGGKTSVKDCILFCTFHHQVTIHQMGWTVVLNPDGTTTAWNRTKPRSCTATAPQPAPGNTPRAHPGPQDSHRPGLPAMRQDPLRASAEPRRSGRTRCNPDPAGHQTPVEPGVRRTAGNPAPVPGNHGPVCDERSPGLLSVLPGEPLPCRLLGHAERLPDAGPADAAGSQGVHVVVDGGVDLGDHRLDAPEAREQLVVRALVPGAELGCLVLGEDQVAQADALVADVDARAGDELADGPLVLAAEGAVEGSEPAGSWCESPRSCHIVKVALTIGDRQGYPDEDPCHDNRTGTESLIQAEKGHERHLSRVSVA